MGLQRPVIRLPASDATCSMPPDYHASMEHHVQMSTFAAGVQRP